MRLTIRIALSHNNLNHVQFMAARDPCSSSTLSTNIIKHCHTNASIRGKESGKLYFNVDKIEYIVHGKINEFKIK